MKNITLIFLCCSAFLIACDNASENSVSGDGEKSLLDKVVSFISDTTKKTVEDVDDAIESTVEMAKDTTKNVVEKAEKKTTAIIDSTKETTENVVQNITDKASAVIEEATIERATAGEVVAKVDSKKADNKEGETIYKNSCNACHGAGVAGSPMLGDKGAWIDRIAQGKAVLVEHAVKGFRGKEGYYMPAKGGSPQLTEDEIVMVVDYMISRME